MLPVIRVQNDCFRQTSLSTASRGLCHKAQMTMLSPAQNLRLFSGAFTSSSGSARVTPALESHFSPSPHAHRIAHTKSGTQDYAQVSCTQDHEQGSYTWDQAHRTMHTGSCTRIMHTLYSNRIGHWSFLKPVPVHTSVTLHVECTFSQNLGVSA